MAFPAEGDVETAIDNLLAVAAEDPTRRKARQLHRKVLEIASLVEQVEPTTYAGFYSEANGVKTTSTAKPNTGPRPRTVPNTGASIFRAELRGLLADTKGLTGGTSGCSCGGPCDLRR